MLIPNTNRLSRLGMVAMEKKVDPTFTRTKAKQQSSEEEHFNVYRNLNVFRVVRE